MSGLALYRQLLQVAERWPVDAARRNRDLGQHLQQRLPEAYRALASDTQGADAAKLVAQAEAELKALERLLGNHYKNKYPRVRDVAATNTDSANYGRVLSNSGQELFKEQALGPVARLKRWVGAVFGRTGTQ